MKIVSAWIDDPTLEGELGSAQLCVEVDELPDVTIEPSDFDGGWVVGKYGPFVCASKYETPQSASTTPVSAGDFNIRFRGRFPAVVDVSLFLTSGGTEIEGYSLPLNRARQCVRKHCTGWKLELDDHAGQGGSLLWKPVEIDPTCRWKISGKRVCGRKPAGTVRVHELDLHYCSTHRTAHNEQHRLARQASPSSK